MKKFGLRFFILVFLVSLFANFYSGNPLPVEAKRAHYHAHEVEQDAIRLKFTNGSGAQTSDGVFVGNDQTQFDQLNTILASAQQVKAEKLYNRKSNGDERLVADRLEGYFTVRFQEKIDVSALIDQLDQLSIIEVAYPLLQPAPLPTANYTNLQKYLTAAPTGVDANFAATYPAGNGSGVTIVDLEYSWNFAHEDLAKANGALVPHGTPVDPFNDTNHGTAVIGEMVSTANSFGVSGITPSANLKLVNTYSSQYGWNIAGAIATAMNVTQPGDVILIEQQMWGPTPEVYDFVPVEWDPAVYDAIKAATAAGRIVIEPAGNGAQNLDNTAYYGTSFPMGKTDSGAIIVGAANACTAGSELSRMSYSTYGSRVNLQGPGCGVVTTGYGDLYSNGLNAAYTQSFSGTSSASPVVASAAASLSAAYEQLNGGAHLSAVDLRNILTSTGTAQNSAINPGQIGPQPNLAKALLAADTAAPSAPSGFTLKLDSRKKPLLAWTLGSDNVQIVQQQIFRNGVLWKTVSGTVTSYTDTTAKRRKTYTYMIRSVDSAGRFSPFTTSLSISIP